MLERIWGKGNSPPLLVEVKNGTTALDISMAISQKMKKQLISRPRNSTFGYILKKCSILSQGHVLNYVHSSIICHSQNLETTSIPLDWSMDKENVACLHNGVVHSRKKWRLEINRQWMDLENIILSEVTQTQKDKYHMYSFISGFKT